MTDLPDVDVLVLSPKPVIDALVPTIEFEAQVTNRSGEGMQGCYLTCEAYMNFPNKKLYWGSTNVVVGSFSAPSPASCKLRLSCGYDANLSVAKYLETVSEGEIPLELNFDGICFWGGNSQNISRRTKDTTIPTSTWRSLVLAYYRNARWIMITSETLKTLEEFRDKWQLHTHDEVIKELIKSSKSLASK